MYSFKERMKREQIAWRGRALRVQAHGMHNGRPYAHVLPEQNQGWLLNLWGPIRQGVAHYLNSQKVQKHTGAHNLLSSWVVCANLYFPFGQSAGGRDLLAGFLRQHVAPGIASVTGVELEFAFGANDPRHPRALLGESEKGARGASQTSPDAAFMVRMNSGKEGLVLTESKFTEHSFYECSGHKALKKGSGGSPCCNGGMIFPNPQPLCQHVAWKRRYWDHLYPVTNVGNLQKLKRCPAATAGYQLFRQQALAEGIAAHGHYELVVSSVAYDQRNTSLMRSLMTTGISNLEKDWNAVFQGRAKFKVFTHQAWVEWVRRNQVGGQWDAWSDYVLDRYWM